MEIIQKSVLAISDPGVASLYTTRKAEQMETAITYFLKNLPSLTETFLDDFRTGPAEIFKILFSLPSRGRPLCTGGEKLPFMYQDIFSLFPNGEVENFLILRYVAGGMPPGMKRGRHCEKRRPSFGTFCPKSLRKESKVVQTKKQL